MSKFLILISGLFTIFLTGCSSFPMSTNDKMFSKYSNYDYCKIESTKQSEDNSCGSACLVSVLNKWDVKVTEQYLLDKYPMQSNLGHSIFELLEMAKKEGVKSYGFSMSKSPKKELEEQILKGRPIICAVDLPYYLHLGKDLPIFGGLYRRLTWRIGKTRSHYVVIFGLNDKNFLAVDPSYGIVVLNKEKFYSCWEKMDYCVLLCVKKV